MAMIDEILHKNLKDTEYGILHDVVTIKQEIRKALESLKYKEDKTGNYNRAIDEAITKLFEEKK